MRVGLNRGRRGHVIRWGKGKVAHVHTMKAYGGGRRYSSTRSQPRRYIGSGQHHAPAALPPGMNPGTHCTGGWVGARAGLDVSEKTFRWNVGQEHNFVTKVNTVTAVNRQVRKQTRLVIKTNNVTLNKGLSAQ